MFERILNVLRDKIVQINFDDEALKEGWRRAIFLTADSTNKEEIV